ncbi:MAG: inositol monophosphatase [Candidatus Marinimicrobia bacterium]|nr:inositol monophosphatase [Candidatus Neomarinimicrobiota bacterium]MCF7828165.1 inositol monophosphatase [Candidatus Neomarinimicrobiota bacterium]MCF7879660.1 inositol monophosphatase [Candidatus Neomarinimicrobiota bacterium]
MNELFQVALNAAQVAGDHIEKSAGKLGSIDYKGRADMVTDVDRTSERLIVESIHETFPDHDILAEESDVEQSDAETRWIIDPLDGTTNFVHGYQHYAVSIAVEQNGELVIGIVHNSKDGELYSAIRGQGAFLNKEPIQVSSTEKLSSSLLSTGLPYKVSERWYKSMELFKLFYYRSHGVRRDGSAALDLCYVASGRFDGFWELDLNPWDVAAGTLILQEAGGTVSKFDGSGSTIFDGEILASNGKIHQAMQDVIGLVPSGE